MKILIAGDFAPNNRIVSLFNEGYFEQVLESVRLSVKESDYSIVNLEAPIIDSALCNPIKKTGPSLRTNIHAAEAIKWAGFNGVTLANNHLRDYGDNGVSDTLFTLSHFELSTFGAGLDIQEASKTNYIKVDDETIAIINCCEHEFSIASTARAGTNPLTPIQQYYAIEEAKSKADFIVVIVHGGTEWYNLPTPRMKETYRFFIDVGADAVVNHHQHCYSGYEVYKEKPIFYGLGNFCFDKGAQKPNFWNEGFMVMLDLKQEGIGYQLFPYVQCAEEPTVQMLEDASVFNKKIERLNQIIADEKLLKKKFHELAQGRKKTIRGLLTPYSTRIMKSLYAHGLLPSFVSTNREISLLAHTQCESHRDLLIDNLKYSIE